LNKLDEELIEKIQNDINENKILEALYKEYKVQELLQFNEFNLSDKIKDNPFISEQFRLLYIKEAHNLKRVEMIYDKKLGETFDHFKFEDERTLSKTEIEKYYIPKDETLNSLKAILNKQVLRTEFFESVWKSLDKQSWMMKLHVQELKGV